MESTKRYSDYSPSAAVAKKLGIRRQTLAKWRGQGKGPGGWFYLSPTRCVYPVEEVEAFIRERTSYRPTFSVPRPKQQPRTNALTEEGK
jgi:transposase-like protein